MTLKDEIRDKMMKQIQKDTDRIIDILWSPLPKGPPFPAGGIMHRLVDRNDGYPIINNKEKHESS